MRHPFQLAVAALAVLMMVFFITPYSVAQEQNKKDIQSLKGELETMRDLRFKKDVPVVYLTRQEVREYVKKELSSPLQKKRLALEELMLKTFGYIKSDFDVENFYIKMYTEQAMGIYDFREKRFILSTGNMMSSEQREMAASLNMDMEKAVVIHELDHAIQDQHFNLSATIQRLLKTSTDEALAGQSVFEGEATYIMFDYMLRACGFNIDMLPDNFLDMMSEMFESPNSANEKMLSDAPPYFRETSIFPYLHGMAFIKYVKSRKGWNGVNALYSSLPVSTAQVINPVLYEKKVAPLTVAFPQSLLKERKVIIDDSLGEFLIEVLLSQYLGRGSEKRTEGWTGDRYLVIGDHGKSSLIWLTEWNSDKIACQMAVSFEKLYSARYPDIVWEKKPEGFDSKSAKGSPSLLLARRGTSVLVLQGFSEEERESLKKSIWSLSRISR